MTVLGAVLVYIIEFFSITANKIVYITLINRAQHSKHNMENGDMITALKLCRQGFKTGQPGFNFLGPGGHYMAALYSLHWPQ